MGLDSTRHPSPRRRTIVAALGASLLLVLVVAGLAFANSIGAARVADNARALHWANSATGMSALARAALVQASTFVELEDEGLVSEDDVTYAIEQADRSYAELAELQELGDKSASHPLLTRFVALVGDTVEALRGGDHESAETLISTEVETAYVEMSAVLQEEQNAIQADIAANTATASRVNAYVIFILTLAIPGAAVVTYWWIARRQVREHQTRVDAQLETERDLSKAKDSFIAGLSHELRTPLTSIYGFAEVLADEIPPDAIEHNEAAQIISNEAAEMTRMVDDLLLASRLESTGVEIELKPTRASSVIESAVRPFERAGLGVRREPSDSMVYVDSARLRHVLVNLVSNAARHGGDNMGVDVSEIEGVVDIEVWDDGQGVPEDQVDKLFQRYVHQGSESLLTGSVGLGLAVASHLVDMMGGSISYQRFAGKTYFIIRVPAYEPTGSGPPDAESVTDVIRALSA